jgi:dipeptidyl aminopeptidase/acylaminoacyl peptidase
VRFIARLEAGGTEADGTDWVTTVRAFKVDIEKTARVSPDGKTLLFSSQRRLSAYENEGTPELYLYREGAGVSCVSCNPTGEAPGRQPRLGNMATSVLEPGRPAATLSRNLSADGSRVFFETTDPLVVEDTNGKASCPQVGTLQQGFSACTDTYEWEAPGTGTCTAQRAVAGGGCIYLLSTGKGSEPAQIGDASGEGGDVFFFTRSHLVGQDEDSLVDVYDARVDGGLSGQNPPPPNPCVGIEGCRSQGQMPAPINPPPSFSGPGNPKAKGCPKGKRKVKGRCVKKTKKHKPPGR